MSIGLFDKGENIYVYLHWPSLDLLSMKVVKNCPQPQTYMDILYLNLGGPPIYLPGTILDKKLNKERNIHYCIKLNEYVHISKEIFNLLRPICSKHQNLLTEEGLSINVPGHSILIVEVPEKLTSYYTGINEYPIQEKNKNKLS